MGHRSYAICLSSYPLLSRHSAGGFDSKKPANALHWEKKTDEEEISEEMMLRRIKKTTPTAPRHAICSNVKIPCRKK